MDAAEIDKELHDLELKAEQLRALYEQYFMGLERLEPLVMRKDVERRVRILRRAELRNTAQRFKFSTLVQRFNTMQQHWARVVREIENGTYKRDVIRAAARFGESALTLLGAKKKTKGLLAAVAQVEQRKRAVEETYDLEAADLIEEEDDDDDAPTPPKLERVITLVTPAASAGLQAGDLPVVGEAAAPRRAGAQRWASAGPPSDPGSAIRASRGEVTAAPAEPPQTAGFGELDLDFGVAPLPPVAAPARAAPKPLGPLPAVTAPPVRAPGQPATGAKLASQGAAVASKAPASGGASLSGFGVLDMSLDDGGDAPAPPAPRSASPALTEPTPSSPASGVRAGGARAGQLGKGDAPDRPLAGAAKVAGTPSPAHPPAASGAAGGDSELADQRIRQIYAKYVETKRSTQESTAGVTFEKLAASLRAQATKLKSAHPNRSIDYEVVVKDGKTHLKPVLR